MAQLAQRVPLIPLPQPALLTQQALLAQFEMLWHQPQQCLFVLQVEHLQHHQISLMHQLRAR